MTKNSLVVFASSIAVVILLGCSPSQPEVTPSTAPEPTIPVTTNPSPTAAITASPAPTIELTPTADVQLSAEGPWFVFSASPTRRDPNFLYAVNANGTGRTLLFDKPVLTFAVQPAHLPDRPALIAYVSYAGSGTDFRAELNTISMPGGEIKTITPLLSEQAIADDIYDYDLSLALQEGGLAWSQDGHWLAFVAVLDGSTSDVYLYDSYTGAITRLTSGNLNAFALSWSPNGDYVIHGAFDYVGMGGPFVDDMWAARLDGLASTHLLENLPEGQADYEDVRTIGWASSNEIILTIGDFGSPASIDRVNIVTGEQITMATAQVSGIAYSPEHETMLVSSLPNNPSEETPLLLVHNGEQTEIRGYFIGSVEWLPAYDTFIGITDDDYVYAISPAGATVQLPFQPDWVYYAPTIYPSPDGALWAWHTFANYDPGSDLWIGEPLSLPVEIILPVQLEYDPDRGPVAVSAISWSPDSQHLIMLTNSGLWVASGPLFQPVLRHEDSIANDWRCCDMGWVQR